jgi:hypothetical protein
MFPRRSSCAYLLDRETHTLASGVVRPFAQLRHSLSEDRQRINHRKTIVMVLVVAANVFAYSDLQSQRANPVAIDSTATHTLLVAAIGTNRGIAVGVVKVTEAPRTCQQTTGGPRRRLDLLLGFAGLQRSGE